MLPMTVKDSPFKDYLSKTVFAATPSSRIGLRYGPNASTAECLLPDGTLTTRYTFTHALYRDVLLQRLGAGRRAKLHQSIGEWMEAANADRAGEVAAELAMHFEHARDYWRAAQVLPLVKQQHGDLTSALSINANRSAS